MTATTSAKIAMQIAVANQKTKSIRPRSSEADGRQPGDEEGDGRDRAADQDPDRDQLEDRSPAHGRPRLLNAPSPAPQSCQVAGLRRAARGYLRRQPKEVQWDSESV